MEVDLPCQTPRSMRKSKAMRSAMCRLEKAKHDLAIAGDSSRPVYEALSVRGPFGVQIVWLIDQRSHQRSLRVSVMVMNGHIDNACCHHGVRGWTEETCQLAKDLSTSGTAILELLRRRRRQGFFFRRSCFAAHMAVMAA